MFGIAANVARNHARGRQRYAAAMHVLGEQPTPFSEPVDDVAARRELLRRMQAGLKTLPHDHRVALVMCDLEGATGEDARRRDYAGGRDGSGNETYRSDAVAPAPFIEAGRCA